MCISILSVTAFCSMVLTAHSLTVQTCTASIYHRYYLIKRLDNACFLLQDESIQQKIPYALLDETVFKSNDIYTAVVEMKTSKSLAPLCDRWNDFRSYKNIYDSLYKYEFATLIQTLYALLQPVYIKKNLASIEHILYAIDAAVELHFDSKKVCRSEEMPNDIDVTVDCIAKRFYILKRLQKCMHYLEALHAKKFDFKEAIVSRADAGWEIESFQHDRVRESVEQMIKTKDLVPLLKLCEEAKQYRFAQDDVFLQEMLMQIFLVYKTILLKHSTDQTGHVIVDEMAHVLEIYEHVSSMPLDETLEAIDTVTNKLIAIQTEDEMRFSNHLKIGMITATILIGMGAYYISHNA